MIEKITGRKHARKNMLENFIARNEIKIYKLLVIKLGIEFTSERFLFVLYTLSAG